MMYGDPYIAEKRRLERDNEKLQQMNDRLKELIGKVDETNRFVEGLPCVNHQAREAWDRIVDEAKEVIGD